VRDAVAATGTGRRQDIDPGPTPAWLQTSGQTDPLLGLASKRLKEEVFY
jgi:hypothetical protein